ncbi:hypothetical protein [Gluconacetobacter entanii]|uniref:hypothetical protein n=1 Tax=Gluconacetobacter entanii TaxID=108528 RepID=UPI0011B4E9DF|nr:hypothetical protein [Gluconacetobacter entanii]
MALLPIGKRTDAVLKTQQEILEQVYKNCCATNGDNPTPQASQAVAPILEAIHEIAEELERRHRPPTP